MGLDIRVEKHRNIIASAIRFELKKNNIGVNELERQTVSKTIIYKILRSKNYEINSLLKVITYLKQVNPQFHIKL